MAEDTPPQLRLQVLEGPQAGKQLEKKGTLLRIGRTTKSALYIKDSAISEAHAEVSLLR
jgi:pSer/pThr/pTyr-binding forkhead associated (FHA) protein